MKPDWDTLMTDYKDSKTTLVADVDCTAGGESLCKTHGVEGYPTIKYGDPHDLKAYEGGRTLSDFKKFAEENLGPTCGPANLDLCDEADKKLLAKYAKWDMDELDMSIEENDVKVKNVEKTAQKTIDSLNSQVKSAGEAIEKENKKKDDKIAKETKKLGLKFMKAVKAARTPKASKEESEEKKEEL